MKEQSSTRPIRRLQSHLQRPAEGSRLCGERLFNGCSGSRIFNQTIAPYPYEKLALIVAETRFGGMRIPARSFCE
jgi:hypothetical protein